MTNHLVSDLLPAPLGVRLEAYSIGRVRATSSCSRQADCDVENERQIQAPAKGGEHSLPLRPRAIRRFFSPLPPPKKQEFFDPSAITDGVEAVPPTPSQAIGGSGPPRPDSSIIAVDASSPPRRLGRREPRSFSVPLRRLLLLPAFRPSSHPSKPSTAQSVPRRACCR